MQQQQKQLETMMKNQQQQNNLIFEKFQNTMKEMMNVMYKQMIEVVKAIIPALTLKCIQSPLTDQTIPHMPNNHYTNFGYPPLHQLGPARTIQQRLSSFWRTRGGAEGRGKAREAQHIFHSKGKKPWHSNTLRFLGWNWGWNLLGSKVQPSLQSWSKFHRS